MYRSDGFLVPQVEKVQNGDLSRFGRGNKARLCNPTKEGEKTAEAW